MNWIEENNNEIKRFSANRVVLRPEVQRFSEMIEQHLRDYEETQSKWKTERVDCLIAELDEQESSSG